MVVLYVESLRLNVVDFIQVATALNRVCDVAGIEVGGYTESMETCQANLVVLDELLAAGITELEVPEKPC
ncbi:hypothetical protein ES703_85238 [subsurface metagenome]